MWNKGLFSKYIVSSLSGISDGDLERSLLSILKMIDTAKSYNTDFIKNDDIYTDKISEELFSNWLYNYSNAEIRDIKRELSINIEKSKTTYNTTDSFFNKANNFIISKSTQLFENNVWDCRDYYCYKQEMLKNIDNIHTFAQNLAECFPNIYFDVEVEPSLSTLGRTFFEAKEEIIRHLVALNAFKSAFDKYLSQNCSYKELSKHFTDFSGIDCSPQAGRDGVQRLKRMYYNTATSQKEELKCELHTKLSQHSRGKQKPDRIYFHPGKEGIFDNKIIVVHIGEHL